MPFFGKTLAHNVHPQDVGPGSAKRKFAQKETFTHVWKCNSLLYLILLNRIAKKRFTTVLAWPSGYIPVFFL